MLVRGALWQAGAMFVQWRVNRRTTVLKGAGVGVFVLAALLLGRNAIEVGLGLIVAAAIAVFLVRDIVVPVRLSADASGLTVVTGFATRRHLPWATIERVHVDRRQRMGRRSAFLEVDTGEDLYLFSAAELSAELDDVAAEIAHLRTGR